MGGYPRGRGLYQVGAKLDRREFRRQGQRAVVLIQLQFERRAAARAERDVANNGAKRGAAPLQRRLAGWTRLAD